MKPGRGSAWFTAWAAVQDTLARHLVLSIALCSEMLGPNKDPII